MATQARRFEVEPALVRDRNVWAGVRLWTGAMAFVFISFVFAFFYLKELNNNQAWRPQAVQPPLVFGSIVLVLVVVGVVLSGLAVRSLSTQGEAGWRRLSILTVLLLVAAIAVQSTAWYHYGWGPKDGGYASVLYGWTGFYSAALLGTIYWLWTQVAQSLRGNVPSGDGTQALQLSDREAVAFILYFMLGVQVVLFVLLYLIA